MKQTKSLKVRVQDKHAMLLQQMARSLNFVWNYLNELSTRSIRKRGRFLSAFDMPLYTKGANKDLGLHAQTLQEIACEYVTRRKQFKKSGVNQEVFGVHSVGYPLTLEQQAGGMVRFTTIAITSKCGTATA